MALPRVTVATLTACALWISCGIYSGAFIYRGWIPHDEGTIGQSAARVLAGEMPHRDFDDPYTGGLTYLHAASMRMIGVNLRAPRLVVCTFFMAFLAAAYGIGRRVASPAAGCAALVLATVWSVPNYFVSLPSWYNLFFATFGTLAFLHYLEHKRRRWLIVAGACGGFSLLVKVAGLYYLAGGVLFLAFVEQATVPAIESPQRSGFWIVASVPALVLVLLCARLALSVPSELLQVFAPALGVCLFLVWHEWTNGRGMFWQRAARLTSLIWPFAAGAAVPVAVFALFFWRHDALADLIRGVFILPQRRLAEASATPPPIATLGLAAPYVALLLSGRQRAIPRECLIAAGIGAVLGASLAFGNHPQVYQGMWAVARAMPLAAAAAGLPVIAQLAMNTSGGTSPTAQRVFLVVTMAAVVALVQFPYATPIYFCYAAPMTLLAIVAVIFARPYAPKRAHLVIAAFLLVFAVVFVNRSYAWNLGVRHIPYSPASRLDIDRGGLLVSDADRQTYGDVVRLLRARVGSGTIYAGPDCPEVYFLSGFPNPTRALFEFLSPDQLTESSMTELLRRSPIRAVVINTRPEFSPPLDPAVVAVLERRFPAAVTVGKFVLRFE